MEKPYWEGKEFSYYSHKKSHAIQEQIRIISTVCSVIVLCMHWEINVEAISDSWTAGSRIVPDAKFRIKERITDTSQANIRNLLNL